MKMRYDNIYKLTLLSRQIKLRLYRSKTSSLPLICLRAISAPSKQAFPPRNTFPVIGKKPMIFKSFFSQITSLVVITTIINTNKECMFRIINYFKVSINLFILLLVWFILLVISTDSLAYIFVDFYFCTVSAKAILSTGSFLLSKEKSKKSVKNEVK